MIGLVGVSFILLYVSYKIENKEANFSEISLVCIFSEFFVLKGAFAGKYFL